jgi:excisionase family DNA binding protein
MESNDNLEPLVDATPVAKHLHIARSTVYDQAAKGHLPHVKLWTGARRPLIRFRMSEIEQFLRERSITPSPSEGGARK